MILESLLRPVGIIIVKKTVNTLKKYLTKQEDLFCGEEDHNIEDLKICIESLSSLKNKYFEENQYHSKRHNNLISSTFIETPEWIKNLKMHNQSTEQR